MYELFEHTADLGLRVRAASLEELFAEAGRGLAAIIVGESRHVRSLEQLELEIEGATEGDELEFLFFDWLNELLYLWESRKFVAAKFDVQLTSDGGQAALRATVSGEPLDPRRHPLEHEVKAITYHGLRVEPDADGWLAEVIVDI